MNRHLCSMLYYLCGDWQKSNEYMGQQLLRATDLMYEKGMCKEKLRVLAWVCELHQPGSTPWLLTHWLMASIMASAVIRDSLVLGFHKEESPLRLHAKWYITQMNFHSTSLKAKGHYRSIGRSVFVLMPRSAAEVAPVSVCAMGLFDDCDHFDISEHIFLLKLFGMWHR